MEHNDYKRLIQLRTAENNENSQDDGKLVVYGKAISFDDCTVLWTDDNGVEYKEIIARDAFKNANLRDAFFKYNHNDSALVLARYKNNTLQFEEKDDGVYIRAELANTQAGKDLYTLIKRGDVDKMSFAFTIKDEEFDRNTHTWTVRAIDKIYDVSAVPVPAYENTFIYARRHQDVETLERETLEREKQARNKKAEEVMELISKSLNY